MSIRSLRSLFISAVAVVGVVGLAACADDSPATTSTDALAIEGVWARTSPAMVTMGAAYMTVTSATGDRLISAQVDESIAAAVEIHEVVPADMGSGDMESGMDHGDMGSGMDHGDMGSGMDHGDMGSEMGSMDSESAPMAMVMRELEGGLVLGAGETVTLQPGGYHLMMLGLVEPLTVGSTFDIQLVFENAGERTVTVEVRDSAPESN
jgi:copper(I)-binding protein